MGLFEKMFRGENLPVIADKDETNDEYRERLVKNLEAVNDRYRSEKGKDNANNPKR